MCLEDLKDRLRNLVDESYFLDLLNININDLVEKFEDEILDNFDKLLRVVDE